MTEELKSQQHSGNKYHKQIRELAAYGNRTVTIDVYSVIAAFQVEKNPIAHAIKKLLMAGKRGGKDELTDYHEAIDAINRAIEDITNYPVAEPQEFKLPITHQDIKIARTTVEPITPDDKLIQSKPVTPPAERPTVGPKGGTGTPPKSSRSKLMTCECDLCKERRQFETAIFGHPIDWDSKAPLEPKQGELPNEHV